ncbi:hypothetical protein N0V85_008814 [Neurospora sp. IMI 360204]|nr:hypothetical protein N0V85_008814 [Neurospora sp. IMI 360204]
MSCRTLITLATVLLASLVALFPIVAQASDKCQPYKFDAGEPRRAPTNMPADANVLQAVNMTDFAAELRAAGWGKLHLGYDSFIHDNAKFDDSNELANYAEPGHHQGYPVDNQMWCVDIFADKNTFGRADAIEQMGRFCGPGSPLYGKVLKGPLTVQLRIPTVPTSKTPEPEKDTRNWYWLSWGLYVEDGCEWVHDEEECIKYLHAPVDACSCMFEWEKKGGAVMNRCYAFWVWMKPAWKTYANCETGWCH